MALNCRYSDKYIEEYLNQAEGKIIAVDFDGTITHNVPYPEKGQLNKTAKKYLDMLHNDGFRIVLWTSRLAGDYEDAYDQCINEFDMPYIEEEKNLIHGVNGKLLASFYIDDKASINNEVNWEEIYNFLIKKYGKVSK